MGGPFHKGHPRGFHTPAPPWDIWEKKKPQFYANLRFFFSQISSGGAKRGGASPPCNLTLQRLVQIFIDLFQIAHGGEPFLIGANQ
jgi:hypothetical protein